MVNYAEFPTTPAAMLNELMLYFPDHAELQSAISETVMRIGPFCRRMEAVEALLRECRAKH